jgi:hypothetical protein
MYVFFREVSNTAHRVRIQLVYRFLAGQWLKQSPFVQLEPVPKRKNAMIYIAIIACRR